MRLLGISTVFGNTSAACAADCAGELCRRGGESLTILRGGERAGESSSASEAIAALDSGSELLCLGPLANVACACERNPELPARASLRAVGGNLSSRGFLPPLWPFEFNFARDRGSARFVLSREWKRVTLYPLDVVRRLAVGPERLRDLGAGSPLGSYLEEQSRRWLSRARWRHGKGAFPLWDLPPALDSAGVLQATSESRRLSHGARRWLATEQPVRCVVSFDADLAWRRFLDLLADEPSLPARESAR